MENDAPENPRAEQPGVTLTAGESAYLAGYLACQLGPWRNDEDKEDEPLSVILDKLEARVFGA